MANTLRFKRGLASGLPTGLAGEPLFTTDTFDLYIGNGTGNTRFQKYIASGTTGQLLRGDGSLLTMPIVLTSPANGQVLKYDGTNWVNSADAGVTGSGTAGQVTYWGSSSTITGSNNLFWDATNNRLGIGTATPLRTLHVNGGIGVRVGGYGVRNSTQSANSGFIQVGSSDNLYGMLDFNAFDSNTIFEVSNTNANNNAELRLGGGFVTIRTGATPAERARMTSGGNLLLGSTTDNGLRFQVTGDSSLTGSGTTSATTALSVRNSASTNMWRFLNDGQLLLGSNASGAVIHPSGTDGILNIGGLNTTFYTSVITQAFGTGAFHFWGTTLQSTSGFNTQVSITRQFSPTSGTAQMYYLLVSPTINQTGGANGITRGLYVTPTLTAAADWRSIEWSNNTGWGLYGSGTAANYLNGNTGIGTNNIFGGVKLQVSGVAFVNNSGNINYVLNSTGSHYGFIQNDAANKWSLSSGTSLTGGLGTAALTWFSTGNVSIGNLSDNGLKFQVTGDGFFSGSVGIGTSTFSGYNLVIGKNISGGASIYSVSQSGTVQTDVTTNSGGFINFLNTAASTNVTSYYHYRALQNTIGAGTTIANQFGFHVADLTTAVYNHAFYGNVSSGSNKWNLYMNGTAANYLNGNLSVGDTTSIAAWTKAVYVGNSGTNKLIAGYLASSTNGAAIGAMGTALSGWVPLNMVGNGLNFHSAGEGVTMTLNSSGNLGVGTTTFAFSPKVAIASVGQNTLAIQTTDVVAGSAGTILYIGTGASTGISTYGVIRALGTGGTANANLVLQPTGSVLIGTTTSTGEALQVNGTMRVSGASRLQGAATLVGGAILQAIFINQGQAIEFQSAGVARFYNSTNSVSVDVYHDGTNLLFNGTTRTAGAATFSSTAQAAGFITSGGTGYAVINSAATTVTALRPTGGGSSIMSTNSNGLHIAVGTQAAGDLILASNNTERIRLSQNGFFSQLNATNPSASITDSYIQYSADVTAGNAAPHFRTENGAVIKLYQETTAVGNAIVGAGGGSAMLDDDTFDGYTLRQVVRALRNQGILQ